MSIFAVTVVVVVVGDFDCVVAVMPLQGKYELMGVVLTQGIGIGAEAYQIADFDLPLLRYSLAVDVRSVRRLKG
jgi:hypothetical protein